MDPRSLHGLINSVNRFTLADQPQRRPRNAQPRELVKSKRHGVYFPAQPEGFLLQHQQQPRPHTSLPPLATSTINRLDAQYMKHDYEEDGHSTGSHWSFRPSGIAKRHSTTDTSGHAKPTPAKDIAARYRAGLPLSNVLSGEPPSPPPKPRGYRSRSVSQAQTPRLVEYRPRKVSTTERKETGPRCRKSNDDSMFEARSEAYRMMVNQNLGSGARVSCLRPGCRDILRNFDALTHHLHIHIIDEKSVVCRRCNYRYENEEALATHICRRRSRIQSLTSTNPLKDIGKVFGKRA